MAQSGALTTHCQLLWRHQSEGLRCDPLQLFLHQRRQNQILKSPWADIQRSFHKLKTLPVLINFAASKMPRFCSVWFLSTCQRPNFSEGFWSPSADWTKGLRPGQTACEGLHLLLCAGQRGLPQEGHRHAAGSGGKKCKSSTPLKGHNGSAVQRNQASVSSQ